VSRKILVQDIPDKIKAFDKRSSSERRLEKENKK
jgi:hypothetical protein